MKVSGANSAPRPAAPDVGGPGELGAAEFAAIAAIMQSDARIHLAPGKVTLVHYRLSRRVRYHGLRTFKEYVKLVHADQHERSAMVVALTTNHTHFFREGHHFDHLRATALPWLQEHAQKKPIRIWSAGCSSGEEVYSIAMCLRGQDRASAAWLDRTDVKLLATDISPPIVEAVRRGVYSANTVQPIPAAYREHWLKPQGADFAIADEVRAMVSARVLNLFEPWPMRQRYDAIFCRNVMIYFDDTAKAELEARLADLLVPGGFLYIGHSERLVGSAAAQMKVAGQTIYRKEGR